MFILEFGLKGWLIIAGLALACFLFGVLVGLWWKAGRKFGSEEGPVELYVGNLSYEMGKKDLVRVFQRFGRVEGVRIILKSNGQSKGFGFVEMADRESADTAIEEMNGKEVNGRPIVVSDARSRGKRN